jgi:hypothetical protein
LKGEYHAIAAEKANDRGECGIDARVTGRSGSGLFYPLLLPTVRRSIGVPVLEEVVSCDTKWLVFASLQSDRGTSTVCIIAADLVVDEQASVVEQLNLPGHPSIAMNFKEKRRSAPPESSRQYLR